LKKKDRRASYRYTVATACPATNLQALAFQSSGEEQKKDIGKLIQIYVLIVIGQTKKNNRSLQNEKF